MSGDQLTDGSPPQILEVAREEAHRTIEYQTQTLADIDTKAVRILRLNLLLLSILLTGLSILFGSTGSPASVAFVEQLDNLYVATGLPCIVISTATAGLTYTASTTKHGMSGQDIQALLRNDASDTQNLAGIVDSYARWIQFNFIINTRNAPLSTLTIIFLVYGIVLLTTGTIHVLTVSVGPIRFLPVAVGLLVFTWETGIRRQLQRYWRHRKRTPTEE